MLAQMVAFFLSWFANPSILGIGLALAFGAIWLTGYWPPLFRKPWLWAVLVSSAILTLLAAAFIQFPLQLLAGRAISYFFAQEVLLRWLLLAGMPQVILSGLVQEGAKLVPPVIYWWCAGRSVDPRLGLAIGAVAGAGFGIFEAQWVHNVIFASGCNWEAMRASGFEAIIPFWERFSTVAFHTAVTALAGYGLVKGWGWQFYLIASFLHAFFNYSTVFVQSGLLSVVGVEVFMAWVTALVTGVALWLRWRSSETLAEE